jgi:hypothetical protein
VDKYCRVGQATDDNMGRANCLLHTLGYKQIQHMLHVLLLHFKNGCTNAPHCYVMRTLPVMLFNYYSQLIRFVNALAELIIIPRRSIWCVGITTYIFTLGAR